MSVSSSSASHRFTYGVQISHKSLDGKSAKSGIVPLTKIVFSAVLASLDRGPQSFQGRPEPPSIQEWTVDWSGYSTTSAFIIWHFRWNIRWPDVLPFSTADCSFVPSRAGLRSKKYLSGLTMENYSQRAILSDYWLIRTVIASHTETKTVFVVAAGVAVIGMSPAGWHFGNYQPPVSLTRQQK